MEEDVVKLKRKLLDAVDRNHNVRDAESITQVLEVLENIEVDEELLRATRLGKIVNDLRRQLKDETLARRAKQLVKRWRNYVVLRAGGTTTQSTRIDSVENYVNGKEMSHDRTANENSKTNCDAKISKEHYSRLGTSGNATRSSSVQEQEPAGEVFEDKMLNGSLNRFVEGKCKDLAITIRPSKEMIVTMNTQDWDTTKHCSMTDGDKSGERMVHRGQKRQIKLQLSCCTKTVQVPTSFTPRKKVKTTQELIKTVLNNSDLPPEGARNFREISVVSQKNDRERIKPTCELKLQPKAAFEPLPTPVNEDHTAPLEDCNNEEVKEDSFAEYLSASAHSTINNEGAISEESELSEKPEDAGQNASVKEVQCELTVSANGLNVTDGSVVYCEETVTGTADKDLNCNTNYVKIEGVTGMFDEGPRRSRNDDGFREWHECLSKRSYKGELLDILPYVVID